MGVVVVIVKQPPLLMKTWLGAGINVQMRFYVMLNHLHQLPSSLSDVSQCLPDVTATDDQRKHVSTLDKHDGFHWV